MKILSAIIGLGMCWGVIQIILTAHEKLRLWLVLRKIKEKLNKQGIPVSFSVDLSVDRDVRRIQYT